MYHVLLVDDEYMIVKGLKRLIDWEQEGFIIIDTARNAKEAIAAMTEKTIHLIVTDITMPDIDGLTFIKTAQKNFSSFEFIILSGYQEFNFLKSGHQLGMINYLLKPVNKDELLASVRKVKKQLDYRNQQAKKNECYLKTLLSQWIKGETDLTNEEEFKQILKINETNQWTVLLLEIPKELQSLVFGWLVEQSFIQVDSKTINNKLFISLIFRGNEFQLSQWINQQSFILGTEDRWLFSIGETTTNWKDIPKSYCKAEQILQYHKFYQPTKKNILSTDFEKNFDLSQEIINFNKILMLNDEKTIQKTLQNIFNKMQKTGAYPDDVRHIVFTLFMDIYRHLSYLGEQDYHKILDAINQSSSIDELYILLLETIQQVSKEKLTYVYSENIQKAIHIIHEEYKKDITLKSIAKQLHLNVMYLGQLFKKETKRSFSQYLNQYRMKKARQLLLYSNNTMNEIAFKIGYNNSTYFFHKFKKMNHLTPKEFREKYLYNNRILDHKINKNNKQ